MGMVGKSSRPGKRPSSSSSSSAASCISTVGMVVVVMLCVLGVWTLTSSSVIPSQSTSTRPRSAFSSFTTPSIERIERDPPPVFDAVSNHLSEDENAAKSEGLGSSDPQSEKTEAIEEESEQRRDLDGGESEIQRQQPEVTVHSEENDSAGEHSQEQLEEAASENRSGNSEESESNNEQQERSQEQQQQETETVENKEESNNRSEIRMETEREEARDQETHQETNEGGENSQDSQSETGIGDGRTENQRESEENQQQTETDMQQIESSETEQQTGEEQESREAQQQEQQKKEEEESAPAESGGSSDPNAGESISDGSRSEVVPSQKGDGKNRKGPWSTQADQSENEKERRRGDGSDGNDIIGHKWELCNVTAGPDYIPCLDNEKALRHIETRHYQHRERHCPEESPTCLVPLPKGYRHSIEWPKSRDRIWYNNVPRTKLAVVKGHQNWVKVTGEYLTFPGGGTQFIHGALHYIDFIQKSVPDVAWGKHTRVILDVGCGVASFGGYLFERDVLAMSFAPKDEHEAQVQFALERGIPAISAVMGSQRLPFPSRVFDMVHCARCRVPWHADGGRLLLELNRVLRPGGYFVWSATPVYRKLKEDVEIWKAMSALTTSMCWDLLTIKKDRVNSVGAAIYRKPISNECYDHRKHHSPPMCKEDDDPNAAWYIPLQTCMHRVPVDGAERGSQWPEEWSNRLRQPPYWLNSSEIGIYGKPAPADFTADYEHWKRVVSKSYLSGLGISWSKVRNVMDMRAVYGGFAAALKDLKVWVMNVVNIDAPDTLPIIYERGLFGIYHDWCESFSTYPRTYDLLHADHLFSRLKKRCKIASVMAEVDRILRPSGKLIVRDESNVVGEIESWLRSMHWEVRLTFSKDQEGILCAEKTDWRPEAYSDSS
ncbi:putative methyltransferase PMT27 [Acorus calamus]|uniref:Methyltransferase PMT27 n=1 Tax=Acorus calamus TaxID=4465 RepID=A0AAV9D847_ACOCL|nr:putative methyltransferase PMT27 [Acorus calamus]